MTIKKQKILITTVFLVVYILIPTLILINVVDFKYRFYVLTGISVILYVFARLLGFSNADLGISRSKLKESLFSIIPLTIVLCLVCIGAYIFGYSRFDPNVSWLFILFYVFISSPVQEFIYRGVSTAFLSVFKMNKIFLIILSSMIFSYVHVIYKDIITLAITFVIGLIWEYLYLKSKNIVGVSVSHAVLGILTIIIGVI